MQIIMSLLMTLTLGFSILQCTQSNLGARKENTNAANNANAANIVKAGQPAATPGDNAPRITLDEAKKDFDNGAAIFVDTRPKASYETEHVKGAINLSADIFEAHYKELPKDKKIIAYCS